MDKQNVMQARKISNNFLRQDNLTLRKNLKTVIHTAQRNADIQQKIDDIGELALQCGDLDSLVIKVATEIKEQFGLTAVGFCLSEEFREMADSSPAGNAQPEQGLSDLLFFMTSEKLAEFFSNKVSPLLREKLDHGSVDFFGMRVFRRLRSEALVPLFYHDDFIGSLNLGSNDPFRYQEDATSTDYLKRFARVLSLSFAVLKLKHRL